MIASTLALVALVLGILAMVRRNIHVPVPPTDWEVKCVALQDQADALQEVITAMSATATSARDTADSALQLASTAYAIASADCHPTNGGDYA